MNTNPTPAPSSTAVALPPIPFASGDSVLDAQGGEHRLADVRLVMYTVDGGRVEVPLEFKFNGWWPTEVPALELDEVARD